MESLADYRRKTKGGFVNYEEVVRRAKEDQGDTYALDVQIQLEILKAHLEIQFVLKSIDDELYRIREEAK